MAQGRVQVKMSASRITCSARIVGLLLGSCSLALGAGSTPAHAQAAPTVARPIVQALPDPNTERLSGALARLGTNPRDLAALLDAGDAARGLGDFEAAVGFYRRADQIAPGNARGAAGLAKATLMNGDPIGAIEQFKAAERAGAAPASIARERGLAYDLVGDNATAQRYYAQVLGGPEGDEVRQQLAISQAIAGDRMGSEQTLMPLLNKQDKPGWRARAFTLAIAGDTTQAVSVANTILPPALAQNIAPYLRYMPRLTRAQQAAAANLGRFPRASEIGRDDPRIAAYAPPRLAAADAALVPAGAPLGSGKGAKPAKSVRPTKASRAAEAAAAREAQARENAKLAAASARSAPPEPKPGIENQPAATAALDANGELPAVAESRQAVAAARQSVATTAQRSSSSSSSSSSSPAASTAVATTPVRTASTPVVQSTPTRVAATTSSAPTATSATSTRPAQVAAVSTPAARTAPVAAPASAPVAARPGFDLAALPASTAATAAAPTPAPTPTPSATPASTPAPTPTTAPVAPSQPGVAETPPAPATLAEAFAEFGAPSLKVAPIAGAVDLRTIEPARPEPKVDLEAKAKAEADAKAKAEAKAKADAEAKAKAKAKKPAPPAHPSRMWVQIGVGRDKAAIAFDWRRYTRDNAALFKGRKPYVSEMGRTNRILIGPFETKKAADAFLADAKKAGFDGAYPWTSPAGQVVDQLPVK